jgi:hypothetical protein
VQHGHDAIAQQASRRGRVTLAVAARRSHVGALSLPQDASLPIGRCRSPFRVEMRVSYPLTLRFKILAVAQQVQVRDASGQLMMYVKQKAFKLKEAITVYADEAQTVPLYRIAADRVIDFSATYTITAADGTYMGAVRQKGMRSLWRSRYEIVRGNDVIFTASEENPWSKLANSLFEGVPLIGALSGYVFHPRYLISADGHGDALRATKQPAFLESMFRIDRLDAPLPPDDERLLVIAAVTMIMLERQRG